MVKIEKVGVGQLTVPDKAFDNYYKAAGWHVVEGGKKATKATKVEETEEDEWAGFEEEEEVTKPLSEMNRPEMEAFAAKRGIDISGATSNRQLRELLKAHM